MKKFSEFIVLLLVLLAMPALFFFTGSSHGGDSTMATLPTNTEGLEFATFAGGCFWCMEPPFDKIDGVTATISGYIGGHKDNPTYREVSNGSTGHTEAVQVYYDPEKVTYDQLLEVFWHNIDPTVENRQFCDGGTQYRTGIFYNNDEQKRLAEASKMKLVDSGSFKQIVTEITAADTYYPAEEYHQDYYKKNSSHYKRYRRGCGRDQRLEELWGMNGK